MDFESLIDPQNTSVFSPYPHNIPSPNTKQNHLKIPSFLLLLIVKLPYLYRLLELHSKTLPYHPVPEYVIFQNHKKIRHF